MSKIVSISSWERLELTNFSKTPCDSNIKSSALHKPSAPDIHTDDDANKAQEIAREEGYRAGFDVGHADGLSAANETVSANHKLLADQLAGAISQFDAEVVELEKAVADDLLALALEIARKLTHTTIKLRPEIILEVIHEALSQLPSVHATIHLNPQDAALVRRQSSEQWVHAGHRVQEDPKLERGDVVIESGSTTLDARLATRWQQVVAALDQDTSWLVEELTERT